MKVIQEVNSLLENVYLCINSRALNAHRYMAVGDINFRPNYRIVQSNWQAVKRQLVGEHLKEEHSLDEIYYFQLNR